MNNNQAKKCNRQIRKSNQTPANYNLKTFKLQDIDELTRKSLVEKHIINPKYISKNVDNKAIPQ